MARNTEFSDINLELHRRWKELNEREDQESLTVVHQKNQLANDVIEANRRLIGSEIRKYTARNPQLEPDLFDTAGAELWRAFQMWDPDRSTLRTASKLYIRGAVQREVARNDHPHLSYDDFTLRNEVVRASRKIEAKFDREPTSEELAKESGVSEDKIAILFASKPLSLDQPADGSDADMTLGAIIAGQTADTGDEDGSLLGELSLSLEPEVADSLTAPQLMSFLMRQPSAASVPARTSEIAYMLGLPNNGRGSPREVADVSMRNAYVKLKKLTGDVPTAEQVSILANVPAANAAKFLMTI